MASTETLDLVALICSRLCHDLAGSIGAVNNGVELLAEETDAMMREEAIGLIAQSANDAARRLAFFRLALGASGGVQDPMALDELSRVAHSYFAGGRLSLVLPRDNVELPKPLGKALLLGLALAGQALPRGGTMTLARAGDGWAIRAEGTMLRWQEGVAAAFTGEPDWPQEPAPAMARYARLLAIASDLSVEAEASETTLTLSFAP
ncbi:histidine phosphotransferase family protein [Ferrovibrio sp.]|uniref:histidine phosphotransferase family protein n=1 Tax=Ferrovibrio sp. TaxID=1917215 RepID=UPI002618C2CC|nr:histidine phosphotransferase family protein [Ferrovibrio sp.]